jgi:protocatechuate 3,4-dioxygenase beta subunit
MDSNHLLHAVSRLILLSLLGLSSIAAARSVHGRVVDGTTGKPVPGARVWAEGVSSSAVRTDRQGKYSLEAPSAAPAVRAEAEGFLGATVALSAKERLRPLVLRPARSAEGRVLDPRGRPVPGAAVLVVSQSPTPKGLPRMEEPIEITTDVEGRFRVPLLALGKIGLAVRARGFVPASVDGLTLNPGKGVADLGTVSLEAAARLAGRVVDPSERPVAEAEVHLEGRPGGAGPAAVTGAAGQFSLDGLRAGEILSLRVFRKGYAAVNLDPITLPAKEPVTVVLRPAARVSGTVVNEDGAPVSGASLLLTDGNRVAGAATSDAGGRFAIEGVEPATLALTALAPGFLPSVRSDLDVPQGGELAGLEVILERGAALEGTVTAPSGEPAPGARITVTESGASGSFAGLGLSQAAADEDGRYRLEGVAEGERSIRVEWNGLPPAARSVEVRAGTNRLDIQLEGGAAVSGRVVTSSGEPVEAAELRLSPLEETGGAPPSAISAPDGSFRFAAVSPGRYRLHGARPGYAGPPRDVEVAGDPISDLELRLDRGGALSGKVHGLLPSELSRVEVRASSPLSPRDQVSLPGPDGAWRLEDLGPGVWSVAARIQGTSRAARASVMIEPGKEAVLDLDLGRGFLLSGQVQHDGEPVSQAVVILEDGTSTGGTGLTGLDGRFRIEGLSAGAYSIHIVHPPTGLQHNGPLEIDRNLDLSFEIGRP